MTTNRHPLYHWLEQRREQYTQALLARQAGTTPNYLNQILTGRRRPSPELAAKLRDLTGISIDALLLWER